MENIKFKPLTKDQLIISIDRLTRFKHPETKYLRVFCDIITGNLISPKFKKSELQKMEYALIKNYAQTIINESLELLGYKNERDYTINKKLIEYEERTFKTDKNTKILLDNEINYKGFTNLITNGSAQNLKWLKALSKNTDIKKERAQNELLYPIEQVIITEGATEEILLPEFAKLCSCNFEKEGIYIMPAGGKNQVVKSYYQLVEILKLPIFVLLDKDAIENLEEIKPKLRPTDKIHLIKCGEFEDLLPNPIITRTLENELKNISIIEKETIKSREKTVEFLEEFFRTRGMHEFKKVEFANMIKRNIKSEKDITEEIKQIIEEIKEQKAR